MIILALGSNLISSFGDRFNNAEIVMPYRYSSNYASNVTQLYGPGYVLCGINSVTYGSKSVNQFFDCTGIVEDIATGSDVRSDEFIFGYEDGDLTK